MKKNNIRSSDDCQPDQIQSSCIRCFAAPCLPYERCIALVCGFMLPFYRAHSLYWPVGDVQLLCHAQLQLYALNITRAATHAKSHCYSSDRLSSLANVWTFDVWWCRSFHLPWVATGIGDATVHGGNVIELGNHHVLNLWEFTYEWRLDDSNTIDHRKDHIGYGMQGPIWSWHYGRTSITFSMWDLTRMDRVKRPMNKTGLQWRLLCTGVGSRLLMLSVQYH